MCGLNLTRLAVPAARSWAAGLPFEVEQVGEPVADRAPVDPPAALVAEQRRALAQTWGDLLEIPAQDQVEPVEHRHPPRSRARGLGSLAEPHVDLPERAAAEVHVGAVQRRGLLRAQASEVEGAEQRVVPPCGRVLTGPGNALLEEVEELLHPLRARRRGRGRRAGVDMPCGVEPVDRVDHADPERRLDLAGLARGQERVETLERLDVAASGRRRQSLHDQPGDDPVDVLAGDLPRRPVTGHEEPIEHTGAVVHRRLGEPTRDLGRLERPQARVLEDHRIHRADRRPGRRQRHHEADGDRR